MDMLPEQLSVAAFGAERRLAQGARETAGAGLTHGGFARLQSAMARSAGAAVFADALLAEVHARINEVKAAAR